MSACHGCATTPDALDDAPRRADDRRVERGAERNTTSDRSRQWSLNLEQFDDTSTVTREEFTSEPTILRADENCGMHALAYG